MQYICWPDLPEPKVVGSGHNKCRASGRQQMLISFCRPLGWAKLWLAAVSQASVEIMATADIVPRSMVRIGANESVGH